MFLFRFTPAAHQWVLLKVVTTPCCVDSGWQTITNARAPFTRLRQLMGTTSRVVARTRCVALCFLFCPYVLVSLFLTEESPKSLDAGPASGSGAALMSLQSFHCPERRRLTASPCTSSRFFGLKVATVRRVLKILCDSAAVSHSVLQAPPQSHEWNHGSPEDTNAVPCNPWMT